MHLEDCPQGVFVNKYNMDYNYIEIPKTNFPTLCSDYPEDAKIEVRMFTVADIKLISRVNEFNLKYIIDELLHRCCRFTNMTYNDLYIADRDYILMFLSRRGLTHRGSLECNPEIPAFPGEEYEVPDTRLGEVSSALQ